MVLHSQILFSLAIAAVAEENRVASNANEYKVLALLQGYVLKHVTGGVFVCGVYLHTR